MDEAIARLVVQTYVDGWREGNRMKIASSLDEECIIIESYGPIYHGIVKVESWIDGWLGAGNTVDSWDMTSFYVAGETCFFEWVFACTSAGAGHRFAGASLCMNCRGQIYRAHRPDYIHIAHEIQKSAYVGG